MAENVRSGRVDAFLVSIASEKTVRESAKEVGVAERTVYRWLQKAENRMRVNSLRSEYCEQAVGKLAQCAIEAALTMRELLDSSSDSIRLNAARSILDFGMQLRQFSEFEQRIQQLEERANASVESE